GAWHISWSEAALKRQIDSILDHKGKQADTVAVNVGLFFGIPRGKPGAALRRSLAWSMHKEALSACAAWQGLYDAAAVTTRQTAAQREAAVMRLLGRVPAIPDGTPFVRDGRTGEVSSRRHGSLSRPVLHDDLAAGTLLALLLEPL